MFARGKKPPTFLGGNLSFSGFHPFWHSHTQDCVFYVSQKRTQIAWFLSNFLSRNDSCFFIHFHSSFLSKNVSLSQKPWIWSSFSLSPCLPPPIVQLYGHQVLPKIHFPRDPPRPPCEPNTLSIDNPTMIGWHVC